MKKRFLIYFTLSFILLYSYMKNQDIYTIYPSISDIDKHTYIDEENVCYVYRKQKVTQFPKL